MYTNICPSCGSKKVKSKRRMGWAFIIFLFVSMGLGLIMIPFLPKEYKCRECGARWK